MNTSGDYFAPAPLAAAPQAPGSASASYFSGVTPGRGHQRFWLIGGLLALCLIAGLGYRLLSADDTAAGGRPIELPASIDGMELRGGEVGDALRSNWAPQLEKTFAGRTFASGQYLGLRTDNTPQRLVNLLVGRGPIDVPGAFDVSTTAKERFSFGDVTCAHTLYEGKPIPSLVVCWYSTPDLGVSLLSIRAFDDMAEQAAVLQDLLPELR